MDTISTTPGVVTVTREEFMATPREDRQHGQRLHDDYYHQFATDALVELVRGYIGEERIKDSTDPHLNDIPLKEWDRLHGLAWMTVGHLVRQADRCGNVLSVTCCCLKAAARRIQREG